MLSIRDSFSGRRRTVAPTQDAGVHAANIFGGVVENNEKEPDLRGEARYRTFSDIISNTSIVAAGVRYFLNLAANATWKVTPAEDDKDEEMADRVRAMLMDDPETSWARIVRRATMYRFYGFSVQEWTARRHDDGYLTIGDVAPRAQKTIEQWDLEDNGHVRGMMQRAPVSMTDLYIPRAKTIYIVDDTLNDSPEGFGIFRHLVRPARRLERYEELEGYSFETDLRGVPVGRGPFAELQERVATGSMTAEQRSAIERPMRQFLTNHIRGVRTGLLLDSTLYRAADAAASPSQVRKWDIELLRAGGTSQEALASGIRRVNGELARILGVEQLLMGGSDSSGSFAASKDKSRALYLQVDSTLSELADAFVTDLIKTFWGLNGWDKNKMPGLATESVQFKDIEQITGALRDMAAAGAILDPEDPAIDEIRDLIGLSTHIPFDPAGDPGIVPGFTDDGGDGGDAVGQGRLSDNRLREPSGGNGRRRTPPGRREGGREEEGADRTREQ